MVVAVTVREANHKRVKPFEKRECSANGNKTLKGKPQGWDRHETRPGDNGWTKASRT
jgi:hypothetical protein